MKVTRRVGAEQLAQFAVGRRCCTGGKPQAAAAAQEGAGVERGGASAPEDELDHNPWGLRGCEWS